MAAVYLLSYLSVVREIQPTVLLMLVLGKYVTVDLNPQLSSSFLVL